MIKMVLNCFLRYNIVAGTVFAVLFLFLPPCAFSADPLPSLNLPADTEKIPTGYVDDKLKEDLPTGNKLFYHFDAEFFYTYSDASGDTDPLNGYSASVLAATTYKYNKGTFLSLVYDGVYYKKREFYNDGIGYLERSEFQSHTISPVLKADFGENDRYTIKPLLFFTKTYNKDTDTAGWSDGLYNYKDLGGGVDFQMREIFTEGDAEDQLTLGLQLYTREYPNYESLLDLATGINLEEDEKDYLGLILKTEYERAKDIGLSWSAGYYLFIKWLDDKKVVGTEGADWGVLTDEDQKDYLHMLETKFWYFFEGGFKIGLNLDGHFKDSNQNWFEGFKSINPADFIATSNYYDYFMYRINPSVSYQFRLVPLTLFASFTYQDLGYTDRLAEKPDESYKTEKQKDKTYVNVLGGEYSFNENWALICQWEHIDAESNNENETTYRYNYWADTFSIGFSARF